MTDDGHGTFVPPGLDPEHQVCGSHADDRVRAAVLDGRDSSSTTAVSRLAAQHLLGVGVLPTVADQRRIPTGFPAWGLHVATTTLAAPPSVLAGSPHHRTGPPAPNITAQPPAEYPCLCPCSATWTGEPGTGRLLDARQRVSHGPIGPEPVDQRDHVAPCSPSSCRPLWGGPPGHH